MSGIALVTIVRGRHEHLRRQRRWIAALDPVPRAHLVVSMGDPAVGDVLAETVACPTTLIGLDAADTLPLAAARNRGVAAAAQAGATAAVLLDVDCLPETALIGEYADALARVAAVPGPSVVTGRVRYLPAGVPDAEHTPARLERVGEDHPVRVLPAPGELIPGDPRLLWSLNVALTVADFERIGGFDERYTGYGGEDTDFGQRLAAAGGTLWWTRGAGAFHQHHPVSDPPVEHAAAIARNATLFRRLWGFDPMEGWLSALEQLGHLRRTGDGWEAVPGGPPPQDGSPPSQDNAAPPQDGVSTGR